MKNWILPTLAAASLLAFPLIAQEGGKGGEKRDKPAPEKQEKKDEKKAETYKVGSKVDETLKLKDIDGKELTFKDLQGKVVFIHFWSMTCPYEVAADPKVAALEKRWAGKDVVVLAINANSTEIGATPPADAAGYDKIREHLKKKELAMRVFVDHGNKLADLFDAQSTPHCFVLDKKGVVVYTGGLDDDPNGNKGEATQQYVRDAVEATLEGKEVKVKTSKQYGCGIKRVRAGT